MGRTEDRLTGAVIGAPRIVLNEETFRRRTGELGARTDQQRCEVAGISRASLHRWRQHSVTPSLDRLTVVAERLSVPVDALMRVESR